MTFDDGLVEGVGSENSTRGRSFLFCSLGIFAGTGLGRHFTLRVPENELIALNVPLDPLARVEQYAHHASVLHGQVERPARRAGHRR